MKISWDILQQCDNFAQKIVAVRWSINRRSRSHQKWKLHTIKRMILNCNWNNWCSLLIFFLTTDKQKQKERNRNDVKKEGRRYKLFPVLLVALLLWFWSNILPPLLTITTTTTDSQYWYFEIKIKKNFAINDLISFTKEPKKLLKKCFLLPNCCS